MINTGTAPAVPPVKGLAGTPFWTNREAIEAERVPGSLLVLGGGAVGIDETLHAIPVDDHLRAAPGMGSTQIPESARGWIHKAGNDGFIKLIHDADTGVLVGATSTGPVGGEVLSALIVAVHARVPVQTMRQMICTFPTFHRAIEAALDNLE